MGSENIFNVPKDIYLVISKTGIRTQDCLSQKLFYFPIHYISLTIIRTMNSTYCSRYFIHVVSNYLNNISRAMLLSYFTEAWGYPETYPMPHSEKAAWDLNHLRLPPELLLTMSPLQWPFKMAKWFSLFKILQRLSVALPMRPLTFLLVPQAPGTRSTCQLPFMCLPMCCLHA